MADVGCPESVKPIRYDKRYDIMKLRGEDMKKNEAREVAVISKIFAGRRSSEKLPPGGFMRSGALRRACLSRNTWIA